MEKPPEISGELGDALADLVKRNEVRRSYEEGLRAVAEALGLLKGVGEGMNRFQQSVGTVLQEQRRYSLKQVQVPVPGWIVQMNETWQELSAKVKDEKYLGTHPLEFSQRAREIVQQRLQEAAIKRMKRSAKLFKISNFKPPKEGDSQMSNDSRRTFEI